ncbi:MAG: B12-binding domain-containing radical SAM protein [Thermodesulfobacteriota bacterium]
MKIVFIQPRSFHTWEALNIGYLASYLRSHGYNDINFYSGFFDSDEEVINGCRNADIIGFSCTSPQMKHALELAEKISGPDNYVVFGGMHPSSLPQDTLDNECVDAVVVGEGEEAFLDIVKGNRNRIVQWPYVKNLDTLPFPDREVIKQERNIRVAYEDNGKRIASLFSSRGCPFKCTFCASHSVWSRKVRYRSADNILDEFEQVVKDLRIEFIKFSDDTFTIKKELVRELCEKKIKRNLEIPWGCNVRANVVDEDLLRLMKQAGCEEIWVGVESGSSKILKEMKKGISIDKVRWVFKVTAELGIFRRAYMLLGMPEESLEDIKLSEKIVDEIKPDAVGFTILAPYPGTSYYDPGLYKNVDWAEVDEYENRITGTKFLSNEDLHLEQERLVSKYQTNIVFRQRKENCL